MAKKWNFFSNLYNALYSNKHPVYLINFITERCNAKCPHCFVDFKKEVNELNLEAYEKIALTSGPYLRNVALTGGEPFLREDVFEIADIWFSNSTAQSISITTNGSMPDRIEDFLVRANHKKMPVAFLFSYDFIGEKHSEYRKLKDLHLKVLESYNLVKKFHPLITATFQITVNPNNYESVKEIYEYILQDHKVKNINCSLIRGKNADDLDINLKQDIGKAYKTIQTRMNNDFDKGILEGHPRSSFTNLMLNAKNQIIWKDVYNTFMTNKYIVPCKAGSLLGIIYSNGDVAPCELLTDKICNLKDYDYDFAACWASDNAKTIRENILKSKCRCTFECAWLMNIFASPRYYPQILAQTIKDTAKQRCNIFDNL